MKFGASTLYGIEFRLTHEGIKIFDRLLNLLIHSFCSTMTVHLQSINLHFFRIYARALLFEMD